MDCSRVRNEEQLRKAFSAVFPTTDLNEFTLKENYDIKVLENGVFGNVSFRRLDINHCVLETVEKDALTSSLSTLRDIDIHHCHLNTFPFEKLAEFSSLESLSIHNNKIHTLPPLSSSSLVYLTLNRNLIEHLSPDVFKLLPAVKAIYLWGNQLTEIPKG